MGRFEGDTKYFLFSARGSWRPHRIITVVALFVSLRIIRLRQMAAIYRQEFGESLLIIATTAAIVAALIERGVAIGIVLSLSNLNGLRPHALIGVSSWTLVKSWGGPLWGSMLSKKGCLTG